MLNNVFIKIEPKLQIVSFPCHRNKDQLVLGSKEMPLEIDFEKEQHEVQKLVFHYQSSLILDAQRLVWSEVAAFDLKSGRN